jgi:hypothetical protein
MENTAHVSATAMDDSGPLSAVVHADGFAYTRFYAPGITFTVGGDRPIHVFCCSQLDFVWNLRGSVVWGEIDSTAQTEAWVYDPSVPGVASHFDAASASTKNTLFIGGLQTGLRWMHELKCAPAVAFVQCMFEMQWWDADGGVAETQSEAVVQTTRSTAAAVSGPSVEATLVGLALGCGLTW